MKKLLICALFVCGCVEAAVLTVKDVVRLSQAGVSEEIILAQIRNRHASFNLSTSDLILLKTSSVPERIIRAMMDVPAAAKDPKIEKAALVPVHSAQWVPHNDPRGFAVNVPADWTVEDEPQTGRIRIQSPGGQRAIIWPMFVPQQQLDSNGAAAVLQQLARRVDAQAAWSAPMISGNAARMFARGAFSSAAIMRWSSAPDGSAVVLFYLAAPAPLYQTSLDIFAGILTSFHILQDPRQASLATAARAARPPAAEPLTWVRWSDPREGAFAASVPQGWNVSGGSLRQSATDIRAGMIVQSPDRQIRVAVGDTRVNAYSVPNAMYARFGMRQTTLGDGSRLEIRRFEPAQQFLQWYVSSAVGRECAGPRIESAQQRQDLAGAAAQKARQQGASNPQVTAAGVFFSCSLDGHEARGYYAVATILPFPGRGGIWYVESLHGYVASSERSEQADQITRHVFQSFGVSSEWQQRENSIAANAVQQDNARAAEIQARARQSTYENEQKTSDMIVKGYQDRSKVYDEIARKRENSILGTVDVVDPSSGKQYKIDNYSDYHWMNNDGVIAGTKTDTSPGYGWREMITLP